MTKVLNIGYSYNSWNTGQGLLASVCFDTQPQNKQLKNLSILSLDLK